MNKLFIVCTVLLIMASCGPKSTLHPASKTKSANRTVKQSKPKYNGISSIPMRREGGVCYVVVKINGVEMEVIFDTGASDVVISSIEALFLLKHGKLTEDDIIGTSYYRIANGGVSAGTVIRLKSVQIGDRILTDVRATVVDNMEAPLLLGQSALDRFTTVSIDYTNNIINIQ